PQLDQEQSGGRTQEERGGEDAVRQHGQQRGGDGQGGRAGLPPAPPLEAQQQDRWNQHAQPERERDGVQAQDQAGARDQVGTGQLGGRPAGQPERAEDGQ